MQVLSETTSSIITITRMYGEIENRKTREREREEQETVNRRWEKFSLTFYPPNIVSPLFTLTLMVERKINPRMCDGKSLHNNCYHRQHYYIGSFSQKGFSPDTEDLETKRKYDLLWRAWLLWDEVMRKHAGRVLSLLESFRKPPKILLSGWNGDRTTRRWKKN